MASRIQPEKDHSDQDMASFGTLVQHLSDSLGHFPVFLLHKLGSQAPIWHFPSLCGLELHSESLVQNPSFDPHFCTVVQHASLAIQRRLSSELKID